MGNVDLGEWCCDGFPSLKNQKSPSFFFVDLGELNITLVRTRVLYHLRLLRGVVP